MALHWEQREGGMWGCHNDRQGSTIIQCPEPRTRNVLQKREECHIPKDSPAQNDSSAPTENIALRNKNWDKKNPIKPRKGKKGVKLHKKA